MTLDQIDKTRVPQHVAIIMDGNGRWAMKQQHERLFGHQNAFTAVRQTVEGGVKMGVKYMTLYTFSTENWNRPQAEVDGLMELLIKAVREETETLMKNNVRLTMIGDLQRLPERSRTMLEQCIEETAGNTAMTLILALSYSSRWEIAEALKEICRQGLSPEAITEETLRQYLTTREYPDPDLLIRTGGEVRISNYLLWQIAYSELYFCDTYWPDFNEESLHQAIADYQHRQRRFGKTGAPIEESETQPSDQ
jgi:undecaprenyl diphosphate synthase